MLKKFINLFRKSRVMSPAAQLESPIPAYLQKDFETELNFKLWTTKGARFSASNRTETLQRLSGQCVGYLSAYVIIIGLVSVYGLDFCMIKLNDHQVNFASVSFSVLILLFSQLESAENFTLKSHRYHDCALEISALYNELRYAKTYEGENPEKGKIFHDINDRYDKILKRYENHKPIDYDRFQLNKPEYFKFSFTKRLEVRVRYYLNVSFKYHLLMYGPLVVFISLNLKKIFVDKQ